MIRRSFLWRLYTGYAVLVALVAAIFIAIVTPGLRGAYEDDVETSLAAQATLFAELARPTLAELHSDGIVGVAALDDPRTEDLAPRLDEAASSTSTRLTLVLPEGTVIADSGEDPRQMSNHAMRPELRRAGEVGYGRSIRYSRTLGYRLMYVATRLQTDDGETTGFVRCSLPLDAIDQRIFELAERIVVSALIALGVALILGWLVGRRITEPLRRVSAAVHDLGRGDYSRRIAVDSDDEVGALASTINLLGANLEERIAELRADRNQTLAILSSMTEGIIAVDEDERILHLNDAAASMLRIEAAPSQGMHVWEAVRISDICELITRVVRGEQSAGAEIRTSVAFGDRELELHGTRMSDADGSPRGAVLVMIDVTELRRLENVRTEFVSNVSHELKTPLTVITGLLESILQDPQMDDATRQRFLVRVHAQAHRLGDLVQDLLSLSRAERPQRQVDWHVMDLRPMLRESTSAIEPLAEEKGLELELDVTEEALPVRADSESLRQVFDNLLSNACRYTGKGGRIVVRARREGGQVVVDIEDTGIGIEPRQQERVFERFYRVDSARSRELGGTGLGLAIVKHIVQGLGGDVRLKSEPGVGSVFTIGIPAVSVADDSE